MGSTSGLGPALCFAAGGEELSSRAAQGVAVIDWGYWYVFPFAVLVAIICNASGFSGAVFFQPFFNFALQLPLGQSIATGIATETIGMSSGACRYHWMKQIDARAVRTLLPAIIAGVVAGLFIFSYAPRDYLRLIVGLVVGAVAAYQFLVVWRGRLATGASADLAALERYRWRALFMGSFSACTGTGVAELSQPLLEQKGGLATKRANATAIALESLADWSITVANLSLGNLRFDILMFSASGVLIGAQLGAWVSPHVPDRLLKTVFALCVLGIGATYVITSVRALCWPVSDFR
jgi:uncharacterized membrane protein YfcA